MSSPIRAALPVFLGVPRPDRLCCARFNNAFTPVGEVGPMLTMLGSRRRCCDGVTRRETLKAGALGVLGGFGLPELLRAEAAGATSPGKAKSVIVLYLLGGAAS